MNLIKRIQINRKDNIEVLQYDFVAEQWISYGSILNQYYANKSDYRKMYLLEYFQGSPVTPHQFVDLFNLKSQCVNNKLMIRFSIPIYRELTESEVKRFNTMVLTFGGNDIQIDSSTNKLLIKESTNEVIDPKITHRKDNIGLWTSGYPFSIVELPEDVEIRDQLFIYWDFVFTFN